MKNLCLFHLIRGPEHAKLFLQEIFYITCSNELEDLQTIKSIISVAKEKSAEGKCITSCEEILGVSPSDEYKKICDESRETGKGLQGFFNVLQRKIQGITSTLSKKVKCNDNCDPKDAEEQQKLLDEIDKSGIEFCK